MNMIDLVNSFYRAWIEKDEKALSNLLTTEKFGIRSFKEDLIFTTKDIVNHFLKFDLHSYKVLSIEEGNNIIYCEVKLNSIYENKPIKTTINTKFVLNENRIVRVFESIKDINYTRIKCVISYDGSVFSGMQIQPNLRTVQGDIEKGLKFLTKEDITIYSSGRTDKGVHALNQVIHFDTLSKIDPDNFGRVLNNYLPDSIYIKSSTKVHNTFHSRYDVLSKEYVYIINYSEFDPIKRNYEWFIKDFDINILINELIKIKGIHNFTSFTKTNEDKEMVREILDVKVKQTSTHIHISIIGKGFLRYMVRYIVGTLIEIAQGKTNNSITDFIKMENPSKVKWKAPSTGLYLKGVIYYD